MAAMSTRVWPVRCDCGRLVEVCEECLLTGRIMSCGECDSEGMRLTARVPHKNAEEGRND
jgi:hypothetical protein